ncbi:class I SAM-dependent methyltransferase [Nonomuraea sp. NPDC050680]|uniref:class I SAM-dependent methyltransferase n=1 Tax=Nonomuraea sp. NPDC050680 TaxID=3154630 RepID=UPI0033EE5BD4
MTAPNTLQDRWWNGQNGRHRADHHDRYDKMAAPINDHLFAAAGIRTGDQVLDVGCGTGETTRLAASMSRDGHATGIDLSAPMLERASITSAAAGITNVTFIRGDAQTHPFEPGGFDRVISRAGVMFFDDPLTAFTNIAGATRGRFVFYCHREPPAATRDLMAAVTAHLPAPDGAIPLGVAAFQDPAYIRTLLTSTGFAEVSIDPVDYRSDLGPDPVAGADFLFDAQLRPFTAGADPAAIYRAREAAVGLLASLADGGAVRLPAAGWIVTAVKGEERSSRTAGSR